MPNRSKRRAAAAETIQQEGADTAGDLRATWPFPKSAHEGDAPGARIRVDQVKLFTDPTKNTIERLALAQLLESPFNPRKRYDPKALQELADTIQGVGVMQPVLVRPITVAGVDIVKAGDDTPLQAYEIVFGHRRCRAAKLAGEEHVPAIVRELTDVQSAQLQAIENVQREDLDPIEEAEGFKHYIDTHGITKEQMADEIGMSRTHVYNQLKLLNAVEPVQQALRAKEIDKEVALLIARIHSPQLQERALASLKSNHHDLTEGGRRSYRSIKDFLKEKFTLRLKEAVFPIGDATLVPSAGDCTTCTKRSGNAPEYADIANDKDASSWSKAGPDLCTDPDCWEAKHKAHLANKASALQEQGKVVITGNKARQAISADGKVKGAYIPLKDVKAQLSKAKKAGNGDQVQVVVIQDPRSGKNVEAVKREDVKAIGVKVAEPKDQASRAQENQRREAEARRAREKAELLTRENTAILGAVRGAAAGAVLPTVAIQWIVKVTLDGVSHDGRELLAQLHGFKGYTKLVKAVGSMEPEQATTLLLDCALVQGVKVNPYWHERKPDALLALAKHYDVDLAQIRQDVREITPDTQTQDLLQDGGADQEQDEEEAAEA